MEVKSSLSNSIHKDTDKLMLLYDCLHLYAHSFEHGISSLNVFFLLLMFLFIKQNFTLNIDILTTCILKQNYSFTNYFNEII